MSRLKSKKKESYFFPDGILRTKMNKKKGLIGKKLGMTSIFDQNKEIKACTIIEAGPCVVTQVKTTQKRDNNKTDGYNAIQLGYGVRKEKHTSAPLQGHFKKAGTEPLRVLKEFRIDPAGYQPGDVLTVADVFVEGEKVAVIGQTKGKGFQGVVKRHGFAGVGGQTHGQHNRGRHPGSIGACSFPSRVFKGTRMGGRMGNDRVKLRNLKILRIIPEKNILVVNGAVPGHNGSYVLIEK